MDFFLQENLGFKMGKIEQLKLLVWKNLMLHYHSPCTSVLIIGLTLAMIIMYGVTSTSIFLNPAKAVRKYRKDKQEAFRERRHLDICDP